MKTDSAQVNVGTIIKGRYRLVELLGVGGMGRVYKAWHTNLHRDVALKFLGSELRHDSDALARFQREARTCVRIRHRNIVGVLDLDTDEASGQPFMVMDYCRGEPLYKLIKVHGNMATTKALAIVLQILSALEEAHYLEVVHRDINPSNVLVEEKGDDFLVKVLDFGIVKGDSKEARLELGAPMLTQPGTRIGTPGYMSPEQLNGEQVDSRTDLFSVGVLLYELLAGRRPWEANNAVRLAAKMTQEEPRPLSETVPDPPRKLVEIVNTALQKDPNKRYRSAREFAEQLKRMMSGLRRTPRRLSGGTDRVRVSPTRTAPSKKKETPYHRPKTPRSNGVWGTGRMAADPSPEDMAIRPLDVLMAAFSLGVGGIVGVRTGELVVSLLVGFVVACLVILVAVLSRR